MTAKEMDKAIRRRSIQNIKNPEWGTFGISDKYDDGTWIIFNERASRIIFEGRLNDWKFVS